MTDDRSHAFDSTDAGDAPVSAESLDRLREAAEAAEQVAKVYGSHPDSLREAAAEITARNKVADEQNPPVLASVLCTSETALQADQAR
jgi:hypothetical protein